MRPFRVYFDTSVIGGCLDETFSQESLRLMELVRRGRLRLLLGAVVMRELERAPHDVVTILETLPSESIEFVAMTSEIVALRDAYLRAGIISPQWSDDAAHVATATVARADAIVSWNFRHIVRLDKIRAFNAVNLMEGYGVLTILSPREVDVDDEDED